MKRPVRALLVGAKGRMGQAISDAMARERGIIISSKCDCGDALRPAIDKCDVVIDFSDPSAAIDLCRLCMQRKRPLVIGTTGHSRKQIAAITKASGIIPIVFAPNFSVGVNLLFWLTRKAAELAGVEFDLEIVEMHHRLKKDAPSGTAKRLAEILGEVRKLDLEKNIRHGREGIVGERLANEIGVHAIRCGDVIGEHRVILAGPGEYLELLHRASSREAFASGAIRAARWVIGKPAALYGMEKVLGLE